MQEPAKQVVTFVPGENRALGRLLKENSCLLLLQSGFGWIKGRIRESYKISPVRVV
jgi:hypothetical protein